MSTKPPRKLFRRIPGGGDDVIMEMDWSTIEAMTVCDRSAEYKIVHGRIKQSHYALVFGSALHKALEAYYACKVRGEDYSIDALLEPTHQKFIDDPIPVGEWRTPDRLKHAITEYAKKYDKEDAAWKIEQVETPFSLPLCEIAVNNYIPIQNNLLFPNEEWDKENQTYIGKIFVSWTGVIDLIFRIQSEMWITDHKTTSIEGEAFWKGFELASQFLGYMWATQKLTGEKVSGVLANVIYNRAETKSGRWFDLLRKYNHYTQEKVEEWEVNMKRLITDFIHNLTTGYFPMKTQWCVNKFGVCPYHDVCRQPADLRLAMLYSNLYVQSVWNPLDN